jgi:hypothetical protein
MNEDLAAEDMVEPGTCAKCGTHMRVPFGMESLEFCSPCAHDRIDELRGALQRLRCRRPDASDLVGVRGVRVYQWHLAPGFSVVQARNAFAEHGLRALKVHASKIRTTPRKGWKIVRIAVFANRAERV